MSNVVLNQLSQFDYQLPQEQIAQCALPARADARLLVLDKKNGSLTHETFRDITKYFTSSDVLVLNNTKVIPARLFARRRTGARIEILVMEKQAGNVCKVLIKPSGRIKESEEIMLDGRYETARVLDAPDHETGIRHLRFSGVSDLDSFLEKVGHIPLPPYIDREDTPVDRELYQTVFAKESGAVASPTAGLHFDNSLLHALESKGVEILFVTLHVSYGTFQPVQVEDLSAHKMYEEYFSVSSLTARKINLAKAEGRRITACGTTVVRTLEAACEHSSLVRAQSGSTSLFIYPPYTFRIPDRMITNFHLPKSTLLMLTSAFAGHEFLMCAYEEAIAEGYRFYSYGDAMLIQ
jgi:S-adenosylmethionine:tRNA ribosyltransferase-isomerase